jgi:hypothetical protein
MPQRPHWTCFSARCARRLSAQLLGILLCSMLAVGPSSPAQAQSDDTVTIEALADPSPVGTEERITLTLRVEGASPSEIETPDPPLTRGLALQQSTPSTQRDVSFSNGELTRSVTYQWTYEPVRAGTARFFPVKVVVRDTPYETEPIDVEVVPQSQRGTRSSSSPRSGTSRSSQAPSSPSDESSLVVGRDLFIRAHPETQRVYQNEQVIVAYHLYFRGGIQLRHSRLANAWDATGFWREELDVESRPIPQPTTLNGRSYQTIVLKRVALFPTRAGALRVDPLEIETEARAAQRFGRNDPFYSPQGPYRPTSLESDSLVIQAEPLPDGAPDSFNGAVGDFQLSAQVDSTDVQVGRPVRLRVRIGGIGNIATLQPPAIELPEAIEMYDPKESTSINREGTQIRGTKTFTYVLIPQSNGTYTLPPVRFAYFDPEQGRYRTRRSVPVNLRVTGRPPATASSATGGGLPVNDVAPIMTEASTWTRADANALYRSPWPYAALLAPLLVLGGVAATKRIATTRDEEANDTADRSDAHLERARHYRHEQRPEACYDAVEQAVLHFISDRLDVAASGLTRAQLDDLLARRDVPSRARAALFELLDVCDQARYSPARPSEQAMQGAIGRAEQLIDFLASKLS